MDVSPASFAGMRTSRMAKRLDFRLRGNDKHFENSNSPMAPDRIGRRKIEQQLTCRQTKS